MSANGLWAQRGHRGPTAAAVARNTAALMQQLKSCSTSLSQYRSLYTFKCLACRNWQYERVPHANVAVLSWIHCLQKNHISYTLYTVSQKKWATPCLLINLANVDRFSELFHQLVIRKTIIDAYAIKISTSPAICCNTTLWNSKVQKNYRCWQHPQQTVAMLLWTL